ncbi:MAG: cytochrome c-type biogenesis CcmF C-terminal domain-containing protein, partial [Ilumatobacter sp.]
VWNLSLLVATFSLTILGTFLTRSGIINSVHAFAAGEVDGYLLGFFALVVITSILLIGWRGDRLRAPGSIDSPLSREGAFLANNVVFALFAFIVLLGTVFPLIVEVVQNRQTVVG